MPIFLPFLFVNGPLKGQKYFHIKIFHFVNHQLDRRIGIEGAAVGPVGSQGRVYIADPQDFRA